MQININFCLKFVKTHNTVSRAKTAQSCALDRTPQLCETLNSTLFRLYFTFWLDYTLKLNYDDHTATLSCETSQRYIQFKGQYNNNNSRLL